MKLLLVFCFCIAVTQSASHFDRTTNEQKQPRISCAFNSNITTTGENNKVGASDTNTLECQFCYASWTTDTKGFDSENLRQGCLSPEEHDLDPAPCSSDIHCIAEEAEGQPRQYRCCCQESMCNSEGSLSITLSKLEIESESSQNKTSRTHWIQLVILAVSGIIVLVFFMGAMAAILWFRKIKFLKRERRHPQRRHHFSVENNHDEVVQQHSSINVNAPLICPPSTGKLRPASEMEKFDVSTLHLERIVEQGQFGAIYQGTTPIPNMDPAQRKPVAVKVFKKSQKLKWYNEREVFETVSLLNSPFLQYFYGAFESAIIDGEPMMYLEVLDHYPHGSLRSYLNSNTINWSQLWKMLVSITEGLAALHESTLLEFEDGDRKKPSIVHRGLDSCAIFVKPDLSCCIGDFTMASVIDASSELLAPDLNSKPRYLAPEVLDYAMINMTRNNASHYPQSAWLKQVDVYALGLVFWEACQRCVDLYQGARVPEFKMAFEKEIGSDPSIEQMHVLVSRNRARPLWPQVWKDTNPAIQLLKETVEDCWDAEGEARLTAMCILERTRELNTLWERYNLAKKGPPTIDCMIPNNTAANVNSNSSSKSPLPNEFRPNSFQGETTTTTTTTKINNITSNQQPLFKTQPHQGSNPCQQRNNNMNVETGLLVVKSSKHAPPPRPRERRPSSSPTRVHRNQGPPRPRPFQQPISFVQNDIGNSSNSGSGSSSGMPSAEPKSNSEKARRRFEPDKSNM